MNKLIKNLIKHFNILKNSITESEINNSKIIKDLEILEKRIERLTNSIVFEKNTKVCRESSDYK